MIAWLVALVPLSAGFALAAVGDRGKAERRRLLVGSSAVGILLVGLALAVVAVATTASGTHDVGAGLVLQVVAGPVAGWAAVLVAAVSAVVVAWAAAHEEIDGLGRLLGLLVGFAGAMLVLVLADDLVTLIVGWELVGALSWALVGHGWRDPANPAAAAHAYNATRFGGVGLVLAAGATFAVTGSVTYDAVTTLGGSAAHLAVAGVLLAAVSKSALVPFSPWLFSAMAGPTSVSALLHSSTMVAAGAYVLVRLEPALARVDWFAPAAIGVGLATALAGGVVALLQGHAKRLLAASTSAQYGLMFVAVGAGHPVVAFLHLVAHAVFKAHLFLSAGVAMEAVGSPDLARMRLGGRLRVTAGLAAVAALALAAVPPLGAAWTKEEVLAAAGHTDTWIGLAVALAGGLSAAYATRYHLLAFGADRRDRPSPRPFPTTRPTRVEIGAMGTLAGASVGLSALWLAPVHDAVVAALRGGLPPDAPWELPVSVGLVAAGVYVVWSRDRAGALGHVPAPGRVRVAADWFGIPTLTRRLVVTPTLALARGLAGVDDRVVDAGVVLVARAAGSLSDLGRRRVEWSVDALVAAIAVGVTRTAAVASRGGERAVDTVVAAIAVGVTRTAAVASRDGERAVDGMVTGISRTVARGARDSRRLQTGLVHHQYVVIAIGVAVVLAAAILGR